MQPLAEFPDRVAEQPEQELNTVKHQAFYAAAINGVDPVSDYRTAAFDLETTGTSQLVEDVKVRWEQEQDQNIKQTVTAVIADPTLSLQEKQNAIYSYTTRGYLTRDIREKYKQQTAINDIGITSRDNNAQDVWINTMQERDGYAKDLQSQKDSIAMASNPSTVKALAGIFRDMIPGVALAWNVSVAKTASELDVDNSWYEATKSFLFSGSGTKDIVDHYNGLTLDQKAEFTKRLGEVYKTNPSFDFNNWLDFTTALESGDVARWEAVLGDIASVFNVVGAGWIIRHPIKAIKYFTKIEPAFKPKVLPVGPSGPNYSGKAHAPTGDLAAEIDAASLKREPETFDQAVEVERQRLAGPSVDPISPAGTTATASTAKAQDLGAAIVADKTGEVATASGTTRADVISDWLLPKLDDEIGVAFPDIRDKLKVLDDYMKGVFAKNRFDPFLMPVSKYEEDQQKINTILNEVQGPVYHQASSSMEQSIRSIKGRAIFGRNSAFGFDTIDEATNAASKLEETIKATDGIDAASIGITQKNGQYFVQWDYSKSYDPFANMLFGDNAVQFKFKVPLWGGKEVGISADSFARSSFGKLVPPISRFPEWFIKGAQNLQYRQAKVEHDFIREIRTNVELSKNKPELLELLNYTQENQWYLSISEMKDMFHHLNEKDFKDLVTSYQYYKRLVDYQYNWANRYDRSLKSAGEYGAIYNKDGDLLGYGTEKYPSDALRDVKQVWDTRLGMSIPMPAERMGRKVVRLENAIEQGDISHEFALVDELSPLPSHTLSKIEGYVPRVNKENWYVKKTPKALNVNGVVVNGKSVQGLKKLEQHQKVIGAESTMARAEELAARLREEFPDFDIAVRQERGDTADAILTDYKVFKEVLNYGKKRGERLPTLSGLARLEDPLIALIDSVKTTVRLDAWKDYKDAVRTNFMQRYGRFVSTEDFPTLVTDLVPPKGATLADMKEFRNAERILQQYIHMQYHETIGDRWWKDAFIGVSNVLEKLPTDLPHQTAKEIAKAGNQFTKVPKTLASYLFLYYNVPRQHIVQTQQIAELTALDPMIGGMVVSNLNQVVLGLMGKAQALGETGNNLERMGKKGAFIKDYDETVQALYDSGVMHSVDLNMMLHGIISDVQRPLKQEKLAKMYADLIGAIATPGKIGKAAGYSWAELNNQVGLWMFEKEYFKKNNPGVNWNTPENIAKITSAAWERGYGMATTANAMFYQEGFLGTFTQFAAVSHKAFFQTFSAKSLSVPDRARMAAARALLWGSAGIPGAFLVDALFDKYADEETLTEYREWKRGVFDWVANNVINQVVETIHGPQSTKTDINFADSMSPIPHSLPYLDFYQELSKMFNSNPKENARFASWAATTSVGKAASDMWRLYRSDLIDSPDDLKRVAYEKAKILSGQNNFAKAMFMAEYDDLANKFGVNQGLNFTRAEIAAQLFGLNSQKIMDQYYLGKLMGEKSSFIKEEAQAVYEDIRRWRAEGYITTPEEFISALNKRSALVSEEVQTEVRDAVWKLDRANFLNKTESEFLYMAQQQQKETNQTLIKMRATINAGENEKLKALLKELDSVQKEKQ